MAPGMAAAHSISAFFMSMISAMSPLVRRHTTEIGGSGTRGLTGSTCRRPPCCNSAATEAGHMPRKLLFCTRVRREAEVSHSTFGTGGRSPALTNSSSINLPVMEVDGGSTQSYCVSMSRVTVSTALSGWSVLHTMAMASS
ncbi:Uncharacterised protein [Bordetella pertussis]|nr:Uncharacterised protein [Bordetella pertussis]